MSRIICVVFLFINLSVKSQSDNNSIVPNQLGDYFEVFNHPKSISNFKFKIPYGFNKYREGRDNNVIQIFRKIDDEQRIDVSGTKVNNGVIEFGLTVLKWKDFSKYEMMLSMSNSEIKELMIRNVDSRNKKIDPNEFYVFYEKNKLFWVISGSWSKEKNLYLISSNYYTNKQSIQFSFTTKIKGNVEKDIMNMKKLIDTFELL